MKVVHVLGELRASGAEVMLRAATPLFEERGIETCVIATGAVPGAYSKALRAAGAHIIHVPFEKSPRFAFGFVRALRSERPDVVHIHTERANAALGWLTRLAGVRAIFRTIHNVFTYTGRLRYLRTIERASLRVVGVQHIAIGASVAQNEEQRLRNATVRVDNWIDARFRPPTEGERIIARGRLALSEADYVISIVGNCSVVKNHAALISALPKIGRTLSRPVVCLHAGDDTAGSDERRLAAHLDTTVTVRFLGPVDDVRVLLWASDAFCMPSLYEGLGIAALEALACGAPAVLAAVPGLVDIYSESESVKFVAPSKEGVVQGFHSLFAASAEGVKRASLEAAQAVRQTHDLNAQVEKLVALYRGSRSGGEFGRPSKD